jgi:hypothetical protein
MQFEALSNRLRGGVSARNKLSCYLNGLKDEIQLYVQMLNPENLNTAFGLAKIQEEFMNSTQKRFKNVGSSYSYGKQSSWSNSTRSSTPANGQTSNKIFD